VSCKILRLDAVSTVKGLIGTRRNFHIPRFYNARSMSLQPPESNGPKDWESVHRCPKCGHVLNLAEIDLRTIATGIVSCPKCEWSGAVSIEIVEPEKPAR
jgi:ribosomal protein L37AE/L43A